jgi:deoxycytidylate deaminase
MNPTEQQDEDGDIAGDIVIGLVGPVGCDLSRIEDALGQALSRFDYEQRIYKVSQLFEDAAIAKVAGTVDRSSEYRRIESAMNSGDKLRRATGRQDIMAVHASAEICEARPKKDGKPVPMDRVAHVIHSLKRKEEAFALRKVYGARFVLISVYVPRADRVDRLVKKAMDETEALRLVLRDEEGGDDYGQATSDTFQLADLFLDGRSKPDDIEAELVRFLDLLFGSRLVTPRRDEHAMFSAFSSSLRSGDLSRQVGAAIADSHGSVLAMGCNDAPRFGGGQYWPEGDDARDLALGEDSNDRIRRQMARNLLEEIGRFDPSKDELKQEKDLLKKVGILDITEYGRAVHAEMAAVTDCARRGVSTQGAYLYCTTFPCHKCVKHLVAAGIERVYFIEPYPKSRALELHGDSVSINDLAGGRLRMLPFFGIGPRRFVELFALQDPTGDRIRRKGAQGKVVAWSRSGATPVLQEKLVSYLDRETVAAATMFEVKEKLEQEAGGASNHAAEMAPGSGDHPS